MRRNIGDLDRLAGIHDDLTTELNELKATLAEKQTRDPEQATR